MGAVAVFAALLSAAPAGAHSETPSGVAGQLLRIGTGGQSGTYFPIGSLIARAVSEMPVGPGCAAADARDGRCGVPGLVAVAQTSNGSVANVTGLLLQIL